MGRAKATAASPPAETRPLRRARVAQADVDEFVTSLLTASRVLVGISARSLAAVEDTVTIAQFRTLVVLDNRDQINLNTLADELEVNASTAMRMIDRLLAAGLVTRHENPANRREVVLSLSHDGEQLVHAVTLSRRRQIAEIVVSMPPERRTQLITALRAFADAAGEPDPRTRPGAFGW